MGLCARAQQLERHDRIGDSAVTAVRAPARRLCGNEPKNISAIRDGGRHSACNAMAVGGLESWCWMERGIGRSAGQTMSFDGSSAALETGWRPREISYIKGNVRSEIPFSI